MIKISGPQKLGVGPGAAAAFPAVGSTQGAVMDPGRPAEGRHSAAKTERLVFPVSAELASRIEAEWHRRRLKSRSQTIRVLLEEALKS